MKVNKSDKLVKRVENHLRITARKLVKFDTEKETLHYLIDSFRTEFPCDVVAIMMKEENLLVSKAASGDSVAFLKSLPLKVEDCSRDLLYIPLAYDEMVKDYNRCAFINLLKKEEMKTWFTVPLLEDESSYGFCIIGFKTKVPLYKEMDSLFVEFGKDIAVAIKLAKKKEMEKRKILDIEWMNKNLSLNASMENVVGKIVERAGKGTHSKAARIYLYDEKDSSFHYQPPSFGDTNGLEKISMRNNILEDHFPFLEKKGGPQLTVPLVVNLKTIGVLHVEQKNSGSYTEEDLDLLELLASHVASIIENAKLYNDEKRHKKRLHSLLEYQQKLVKETVKAKGFDGITKIVSHYFAKNIILIDRFIRPISYHIHNSKKEELSDLFEKAALEIIGGEQGALLQLENKEKKQVEIWSIYDGLDLLGYFAMEIDRQEMDDLDQLGIDLALNIFSSQFVKQKLILDAKEQVKDSFINKVLVKNIQDTDSIIQYANVFKWNIFDPHRVAVLSFHLEKKDEAIQENILEKEAQKSILWERIKKRMTMYEQDIQAASKKEEYIFIVPTAKERNKPKIFWSSFYEKLHKWVKEENINYSIMMGIGGITKKLEDYYDSYQQALQTLNVVKNRFQDQSFAIFDELGGYVLLHELKNSTVTSLFTSKYMDPLLKYSKEKNVNLFYTLRVYLNNHGNLSKTSNELYIHRSSLLYRLERIEKILEIDLNNPEDRFKLMLAYRLYDLYYSENSSFTK